MFLNVSLLFLWVASPRPGIVAPLLGPVALRFCVHPRFGSRQSSCFDRGGSSKRCAHQRRGPTRVSSHCRTFELHAALLVAGGLPGEPGAPAHLDNPAQPPTGSLLHIAMEHEGHLHRLQDLIVDDRTGKSSGQLFVPEADWLNGRANQILGG